MGIEPFSEEGMTCTVEPVKALYAAEPEMLGEVIYRWTNNEN